MVLTLELETLCPFNADLPVKSQTLAMTNAISFCKFSII